MALHSVLIAGSGPAGLTLALSLVQNGISVRIIEKEPTHHISERGTGIMPRTLEIEHFLGVKADIVKISSSKPIVHFFDEADPRVWVRSIDMVEQVDPTPAFPITRGVLLGQYRHQRVLRSHIERLGVKVELGSTLTGFTQERDGVIAKIVKNVNGKEVKESAEFKYIIGADGGRSTVRKGMGVEFVGNTDEATKMYLVDAEIEGFESVSRCVGKVKDSDFYIFGTEGSRVEMRGTGVVDKYRLLFINPIQELVELGTHEIVQSELTRLTKRPELRVRKVTWQALWRANLRIASNFKVGNAFVIGDAAHTHSPTGAQGMNSSIQDAFNLGWKLALVLKGHSPLSLLDSYENERIPVIAEMLKITTELHNRTFYSDEVKKQIRSQLKSVLKESPYYRNRKLFQLDINYRWSSVVYDERFSEVTQSTERSAYGVAGHDLRAGDRAPDAPGLVQILPKDSNGSVSRLFDVFKPTKHTILIYIPSLSSKDDFSLLNSLRWIDHDLLQTAIIIPPDTDTKFSPSIPVDFVFRDADGHAFKGYGLEKLSEHPTIVIVRPDSIIGSFAYSISGVEKYAQAVFITY